MAEVVHVRQPAGKPYCGQSVLAMVLGLDLCAGIVRMEHARSTRTRELVDALGDHALDTRLRLVNKTHLLDLPDPCVLKVRWKKGSHYVLRVGLTVHDPIMPRGLDVLYWAEWLATVGGRVTSYLRVRLAEGPPSIVVTPGA